jgi:hypothetical protein
MITRFASLSGRLLAAATFLFTVTACGGGGGGGGNFYDPDGESSQTYFLAPVLLDSNGEVTTEVTSASPATLKVTVRKNGKNGAAVPDVVVTAETTAGLISPATGTALSNSAGVATFRVEAEDGKGAGTITVSADGPSGTVTNTLTFQIGNSGLRLGYLDSDGLFIENEIGIEPGTLLASQAIAQLSLVILDENGDLVSSSESVTFSSGCIASGQAVLDPASPVVSGDGKVSTSYRPSGCSGNDQITASLEGSTAQAFGTVSVASAQANGFTFVSAVPSTIVLRGTGGGSADRVESSTVTFKVVDSNNSPIGGIKVDFSLTTEVGGLSLSPSSAVSSSEGLVSTNVRSGDIPTVVRVIATAAADDGSGQNVSSVSDVLTVTTGLPDQNSISLSVAGGFVVVDGMTVDGIEKTITVRMADKFNNPVPDGTAAVFTTEYGAIEPSCETVNGSCSVTWNSQAPRFPTLTGTEYIKTIFSPGYDCPNYNVRSGPCPNDLGYTRGGRSTVLVTAVGEESFIDRNGNGIMDEAEKDLFDNLPEAFLDNNEDNVFNPATATCKGAGADSAECIAGQEEIFVDFNDNGKYDTNNNPAVYNGLLCPLDGDGVWCSRSLLNVRDEVVLILSDPSEWYINLFQGSNPVNGTSWRGGFYTAAISDLFNNPPPEGSTITLEAGGDCEVVGPDSFTVGTQGPPGAFVIELQTGGEGSTGNLDITVNPKDGTPSTKSFNCVPAPPPADPNDPNDDDGLVVGP